MTVQELIAQLKQFPQDLEVVGYDGSDRECPVSVFRNSSADEEGPTAEEWDHIVVSVD